MENYVYYYEYNLNLIPIEKAKIGLGPYLRPRLVKIDDSLAYAHITWGGDDEIVNIKVLCKDHIDAERLFTDAVEVKYGPGFVETCVDMQIDNVMRYLERSLKDQILTKVSAAMYNNKDPREVEILVKEDIYFTNGEEIERIGYHKGAGVLEMETIFNYSKFTTNEAVERLNKLCGDDWWIDQTLDTAYHLKRIEPLVREFYDDVERNSNYFNVIINDSTDVLKLVDESYYFKKKYDSLHEYPFFLDLIVRKLNSEKYNFNWNNSFYCNNSEQPMMLLTESH